VRVAAQELPLTNAALCAPFPELPLQRIDAHAFCHNMWGSSLRIEDYP
jgi:hypothetical protein